MRVTVIPHNQSGFTLNLCVETGRIDDLQHSIKQPGNEGIVNWLLLMNARVKHDLVGCDESFTMREYSYGYIYSCI